MSTSELLRSTGRVSIEHNVPGAVIRMLGTRGHCSPRVFIDGVPISLVGLSIDAIAPLTAVEAAEVSRSGSEAPLQFGGTTGGCGVILLWTKAR